MKKPRIIIGVDPGTTAACAVLDHKGSVISVFSSKNLGINDIISKITEIGKPIAIGTDKAKVPSLVSQISAKTGAICVNPKEDLKAFEKKKYVSRTNVSNDHERDALASAFFAYNNIRNKLQKILSYVEKNKKEHLRDKLIDYVICKELSLHESLSILEETNNPAAKIVQKVTQKKEISEKDFLNLYKKIKSYEKEIHFLKKQNGSLKKTIDELKSKIKKSPKKRQTRKQTEKIIGLKDKSIKFLGKAVKAKNRELKVHDKEFIQLQKVLGNLQDFIILKKLRNFGKEEFERNKDVLQIAKGDVLLIDDVNVMSDDVIKELDFIDFIVSKSKANKKILDRFVVIPASELKIDEYDYFATVAKKQFNEVKSKKVNFSKLVKEYQEKRLHKVIKTN